MNGVRAADDLVFEWGSRKVKARYRVWAREYVEDGVMVLPPLSATFITYRSGDKRGKT